MGNYYFYLNCINFDRNMKIIKDRVLVNFADIVNCGFFKKKTAIIPSTYFIDIAIRTYGCAILGHGRLFIDESSYGLVTKIKLQLEYNGINLDNVNNNRYIKEFNGTNLSRIFVFNPNGDSKNFAKLIKRNFL